MFIPDWLVPHWMEWWQKGIVWLGHVTTVLVFVTWFVGEISYRRHIRRLKEQEELRKVPQAPRHGHARPV